MAGGRKRRLRLTATAPPASAQALKESKDGANEFLNGGAKGLWCAYPAGLLSRS